MKSNLIQALVGMLIISSMGTALHANSVGIAVLDSGLDLNDARLQGRIIDDEHSIFSNDFKSRNNSIAKKKLLLQYNALYETSQFRNLNSDESAQLKSMKLQISTSEYNEFMKNGHGQNVTGIIIGDTQTSKILPRSVIPSEPNSNLQTESSALKNVEIDPLFLSEIPFKYYGLNEIRRPLYQIIKESLQMSLLGGIDSLINKEVKLVNISLASSIRSSLASIVLKAWFSEFSRPPDSPIMLTFVHSAQRYLSAHLYSRFMSQREKLFIFAAGNQEIAEDIAVAESQGTVLRGNNNDKDPLFPASVMSWFSPPNVMFVAATVGRSKLWTSSTYGKSTIHVAAPGVNIRSYGPEGTTISMTGTSQAAPYVTNTAARMIESNPHLPISEVKEIIMGTVDKKDFLADKVISGGIVNPQRAIRAAQLRGNLELEAAIQQAKIEIKDMDESPE